MFDKVNEALKNWKSLLPMLKPFVRSETKTAVRRKKMNVTTAPNGTVIGVTDPADNTEIKIPYLPPCGEMVTGKSVWVEWLYDNFSTAIAVTPGDGRVVNFTLPNGIFRIRDASNNNTLAMNATSIGLRDTNGKIRASLTNGGVLSLGNSSGTTTVYLRGDGTASSTPLPVNQGGTGMNDGSFKSVTDISALPTTDVGRKTTPVEVSSAITVGNVTIPSWTHGLLVERNKDGVFMGINSGGNLYTAYRNNLAWGHAMVNGGFDFSKSVSANSSIEFTVANSTHAVIFGVGGGASVMHIWMVNAISTGTLTVAKAYTGGSSVTHTTATNKLTITNGTGSQMYFGILTIGGSIT